MIYVEMKRDGEFSLGAFWHKNKINCFEIRQPGSSAGKIKITRGKDGAALESEYDRIVALAE